MNTVETTIVPDDFLEFAREADSVRTELFVEPEGQVAFIISMSSADRNGFIAGRFGQPGNWFEFYVTDGTDTTWCWVTGGPMELNTWSLAEESE